MVTPKKIETQFVIIRHYVSGILFFHLFGENYTLYIYIYIYYISVCVCVPAIDGEKTIIAAQVPSKETFVPPGHPK